MSILLPSLQRMLLLRPRRGLSHLDHYEQAETVAVQRGVRIPMAEG